MVIIHACGHGHIPHLVFPVNGADAFRVLGLGDLMEGNGFCFPGLLVGNGNLMGHQAFPGQSILRAFYHDHRQVIRADGQSGSGGFRLQSGGDFLIDLGHGQAVLHSLVFIHCDPGFHIPLGDASGHLGGALDSAEHLHQILGDIVQGIHVVPFDLQGDSAAAQRGHIHGGGGNAELTVQILGSSGD